MSLTAQFRLDSGRYPKDPCFVELIEDLRKISDEFRLWWSAHDFGAIADGHKSVQHPTFGLWNLNT